MRARRVGLILLASGLVAAGQTEPAPPSGTAPTIKSTAREVLLDLVIRDRRQKQIRDLTPSEIEVYEDGVKQDIRAFRFIDGAEARAAEERLQSELKSEKTKTELNPVREINLISIVFKSMAWENRRNAQEAAEQLLKTELRSNTYIGVFTLDTRLHAIANFSNDREQLTKAIRRASSGAYSEFDKDSQRVLTQTEFAAKGRPGGVDVVGGIPNFTTAAASTLSASESGGSLASAVMYGILNRERIAFNTISGMMEMDALQLLIEAQAKLPGRKTVVMLTPGILEPVGFTERFRGVISSANRAGVTFYGIDVNGLTTVSSAQSTIAMTRALDTAPTGGTENIAADPGFKHDDQLLHVLRGNTQESLVELTESTGGFTISNTNDFKKNLHRIIEDASTHYELAYSPKADVYDGHFRVIEIKLLRPNLTVQTRKGYYALPELNGEQLRPYEVPALNALSAKPRPQDFGFRSTALRFRPGPVTVQYGLVFEVPVRNVGSKYNAKTNQEALQVSMLALIKNSRGEIVEKIGRDFSVAVPNDKFSHFQAGNMIYTYPVFLPPGRYTFETAVVDRVNTRASVQRAILVVPAPNGGPEISSPTLVRGIEPRKEASDGTDPFLFPGAKITPTLASAVKSASKPVVFFTLYPPGELKDRPQVSVEYFREGKSVARETPEIPATVAGPVPVLISPHLAPGVYDIRITANTAQQVMPLIIE